MKALQNKLAQELLTAYEAGPPFLAHREIEMYLQAGELLIQQGDEPRNVFIVLEGAVKIYHSTMKSNDYLIAIEGAGEILGEVEILTGVAYSCSVTAVEKTKVAVIKKEQYQQWLKVDHDFALLINSILCDRLQKITKRAATHLSYPLEYSALRLLKLLSLDSQSITLSVSKGEIADYLGTSIRSVNRVLNNLSKQGVLSSSKNETKILSMEKLEQILTSYEE